MKKILSKPWLYACLVVFLLLTACYYVGGRAVTAAKPWTWNRNDKNPAAQQSGGFQLSASAGFSTSNVNTFAASTTSHSGNACIDFSSVLVRTESEHPLAAACAEKIAEKLKAIPTIKRIEFVLQGPILGRDEPLPPQIVQVDVGNLSEWTVPSRSLSGNVYVSFGAAAVRYPCAYGDGEAPPLVQFEHNATNEVRFTHTGICTQSIFYDKIAEEIAKKTIKTIEENIEKLSGTSPFLPKLPEAFYPAYREASEIPPIPSLLSKTTLIEGRRFMLPHYSLVQIESNFNGTDDEFLTAIQEAMVKAGWEGGVNKRGEYTSSYMRLTRGSEVFYIFQEKRDKGLRLDFSLLDEESQKKPINNGPPHLFLVERKEKMDRDSVLAAIQTLLDENPPASSLLIFADRVHENDALAKAFRKRLLELKSGTPAEQLALVQFFNRDENKDIAREMLLKAWQIRQLTLHPKPDSDYTKLAKELGIEEEMKALPPTTALLCEEYGFIHLTPENCPMEVEIELEKETRFVTTNEEGYLSFLRFTFRHENGMYHTEGLQKTFMEHGSSWSNIKFSGKLPNVSSNLPKGNQEWFSFSVVPGTPPDPGKPIRMKVEFRGIHNLH